MGSFFPLYFPCSSSSVLLLLVHGLSSLAGSYFPSLLLPFLPCIPLFPPGLRLVRQCSSVFLGFSGWGLGLEIPLQHLSYVRTLVLAWSRWGKFCRRRSLPSVGFVYSGLARLMSLVWVLVLCYSSHRDRHSPCSTPPVALSIHIPLRLGDTMGPVVSCFSLQNQEGARGQKQLDGFLRLCVGAWVEDHSTPAI